MAVPEVRSAVSTLRVLAASAAGLALGVSLLSPGSTASDPHPPNDFPIHFSFPLGAAHSTELQYVFQRIPLLDTIPPFTKAQLALSDLMIGYWTRFAATGSPNGGPGKAPYWPRWPGSTGPIQELVPSNTAPESFATFSAFHKCGFWAAILL
jgi:para-nitrobenzyl esterase